MPQSIEYLQTLGIKPLPRESAREALLRHAADYGWREKTIERHMRVLVAHLQEEAIAQAIAQANAGFDDLDQLNRWLSCFGMEEQPSKTKAVSALRGVHINIYDLVAERYEKRFTSVHKLRRYSRKAKLIFPLSQAKAVGLRCFLRPLFSMHAG